MQTLRPEYLKLPQNLHMFRLLKLKNLSSGSKVCIYFLFAPTINLKMSAPETNHVPLKTLASLVSWQYCLSTFRSQLFSVVFPTSRPCLTKFIWNAARLWVHAWDLGQEYCPTLTPFSCRYSSWPGRSQLLPYSLQAPKLPVTGKYCRLGLPGKLCIQFLNQENVILYIQCPLK